MAPLRNKVSGGNEGKKATAVALSQSFCKHDCVPSTGWHLVQPLCIDVVRIAHVTPILW